MLEPALEWQGLVSRQEGDEGIAVFTFAEALDDEAVRLTLGQAVADPALGRSARILLATPRRTPAARTR